MQWCIQIDSDMLVSGINMVFFCECPWAIFFLFSFAMIYSYLLWLTLCIQWKWCWSNAKMCTHCIVLKWLLKKIISRVPVLDTFANIIYWRAFRFCDIIAFCLVINVHSVVDFSTFLKIWCDYFHGNSASVTQSTGQFPCFLIADVSILSTNQGFPFVCNFSSAIQMLKSRLFRK